ncbi:SpoIIE family protein phosphatase [Candidatus Gracilibacteria bacterium]|jgi:serine phosphatase RsbU (regulator of sigma subunit)|nr:SpoIIE family protein phosphatase [Candidatus Gracilibacteria bacterium]
MKFIDKSITRKFILNLMVLGLVLGAILGYLFFFRAQEAISLKIVLIGALVIFVLVGVLIYLNFSRPLSSVLFQIQALLTGKPYKKIYTTRIDEVGVLAYFFNQVTKGFKEVSGDLQDRERMISELSVAAQLQRDILPLESPFIDGLQVVVKYKPATEVGGDSFDIYTSKDKTYIYVGDVTGHGVSAGLMMTMVNSLVSVFADMFDNAFDVVVNVNKYIKKHVKKAMFMTMVMLCFDNKTKKLTFVGAGHEHILIYRHATGVVEAVLSGGVALGMVPDNSKAINEREIILEDGDFIVLYSDGITEARSSTEELYGLERLKAAIREYAGQYSAEGVNYHIAKDVTAFMGNRKQEDDMTLIVMKRDSKNTATEAVKDHSTTWAG